MSSLTAGFDSSPGPFAPAQMSGRKFLNPVPTVVTPPGSMLRMMRRVIAEKRIGDPQEVLGPFRTDAQIYALPAVSGLRITWMGHSSLLIEIGGHRILTDPVWSERASLVSFAGPKRFYAPTLALEDLPPLDAILLSHDHYDHLDRATVQRLQATQSAHVRFICSVGIGNHLKSWGVARERITELNWGQTTSLSSTGRNRLWREHPFGIFYSGNFHSGDCKITATPARHFSGRGLWSRNETLWSSFVIRCGTHNLFFGGDSGPFPGFQQIGEAYGPFDLTMLEIGAYDADWPDIHMGPDSATEAHVALKGKLLLPIHWGLFNLAFHPWREPVERLSRLAEWRNIPLLLPKPGSPTEITGASLNTFWWED